MPLLSTTQTHSLVTDQMTAVNNDPKLTTAQKATLIARLNNSQTRNIHVQLRAVRLTSTITRRKQKNLPSPAVFLRMPVLK